MPWESRAAVTRPSYANVDSIYSSNKGYEQLPCYTVSEKRSLSGSVSVAGLLAILSTIESPDTNSYLIETMQGGQLAVVS